MKKIIIPVVLFVLLFTGWSSRAQEAPKPAATKAAVHFTEAQWKAFEGVFQSAGNKDMYVRFTPGNDMLVAKLLWNNNEVHLLPDSGLTFTSKEAGDEGPIHITFQKDPTGAINQVNVANNGVWVRTKDYKPAERKEMDHTSEQLKPFEGLYQFQQDNTRFIQFTVKGPNLVLKQHWDNNEIQFVPESELDFFSKVIPLFTLNFTKDKDGNITQVLAFKRDLWIRTQKPHLTAAILKTYEGKYQSKDDPDNQIQVIIKDQNLIVRQLWDKKEMEVAPLTDTYFYNDAQSYPVQIIKDKDGVVKQVVMMNNTFNKMAP